MKKALFGIVAAAGLASAANADIVQSWRAVVISNPADPSSAADPAGAGASGGTTLSVGNGQSILFILSVSFSDNGGAVGGAAPASYSLPASSLLRGIGAATSQLVGGANANGTWAPVDGFGGGVYNSNGVSGIAIPGSGTVADANSIKGLGVLSNGLLSGSGAAGSGINNTEGTDVLGIIWTPNNYTARSFSMVGSPFGSANDNVMWFRSGPSNANGASAPSPVSGTTTFTVNIVPAPASLALLGLGGLVAGRRRR